MTPDPAPPPPSGARPEPAQKRSSSAVIIIVLAVVASCCVLGGIVSAIAIPNFTKFNSRAQQAECKTNLKAIFVGQKSYFAEHDDYGETFEQIGFVPEKGRYTYFMGEDAVLNPGKPGSTAVLESQLPPLTGEELPGLYGECPNHCDFFAACAANLDGDPTLDVWSISSRDRKTGKGEPILPGVPWHEVDDLR